MKPDIAELGQELEEDVKELQEEEKKRTYHWLEQCNISMWEFRDKNPAEMKSLEDELDISDWDHVAGDLGLSNRQIERCRKCHQGSFTREMLRTLEELPQYRELTLKEFLEILLHHKRHDILLNLEKYARLGPERCTTKTFTLSARGEQEVLVMASNIGCTDGRQSHFIAKVLLIHSHDTKEDALQLADQLRNPVANRRRLNVVLLQESDNRRVKNCLRTDPWNSIHKWFTMVDVVVPVLSPQFLRQIQNRDLDIARGLEKRLNRFVYSMILDQYVEHGCKNYSCRAVCPERYQIQVTKNGLIQHSGLLKVHWNSSSKEDMENFAQVLHDGAKEFRKLKKRWKKEQMQMGGV